MLINNGPESMPSRQEETRDGKEPDIFDEVAEQVRQEREQERGAFADLTGIEPTDNPE